MQGKRFSSAATSGLIETSFEAWFSHYPRPSTAAEAARYEALRDASLELARTIVAQCPGNADRTHALYAVREAMTLAVAAIASSSVDVEALGRAMASDTSDD